MKYNYIIDDKGYCYVPRPHSVCDGRKRHSVFQEKLGIEPTIVSPTAWGLLANRFEIKFLEE